jgi:hypothetical protein
LRATDEELLLRTPEGDTDAFPELVECYSDAAYGIGFT